MVREIDLAAILDRDLGAVGLWLQGEKEYRQSHFGRALEFFHRAIAEASLLAMAALNGAQAAGCFADGLHQTIGIVGAQRLSAISR